MSNDETTLHVVGAAIARGQKCLVTQRGPAMSLAGKWEFPGGKVELGESAPTALAREISEELNLAIAVAELLGTGRARVGSRLITLDVYGATITSGSLLLREHSQALWVEADALPNFDWAEADFPSVPSVAEWLRMLRA